MNAVECKNLSITRGEFKLKDINLSVEEGEIFAILGRTGSGKTVLLETIAGFYQKQYSGEILLFGNNANDLEPNEREMGFVYQDSGLFPHMTVEENIAYGLKMNHYDGKVIKEKIAHVTELLSITSILKQYPATISGGEKQRTALARSLVLNPMILLLDEPFSALDPATRQKMYGEIQRIHETYGCTIIFVTHDFGEAQHLASRVGIMLKGRLRTVVDSKELFNNQYDEDINKFLRG